MSWIELAKSFEINKAIFQLMTGIKLRHRDEQGGVGKEDEGSTGDQGGGG
jgi:hypothetical protein